VVLAVQPQFSDEEIGQLLDRLRNQGVTALVGTFLDNSGVARAKQVPLERVAAFHRVGLGASYSWAVWASDDNLMMGPNFSVTGDMRMRADLSAVRTLGDGLAWAPLDLYDQDGQPLDHCARGILRRRQGELADQGIDGLASFEIEFTWFDAVTGEVGGGPAYGLRAIMDNEAFFADISAAFGVAGLTIEQLHAEAGLGQIELTMTPVSPLEAADALVLARLILCRVGRRHHKKLSFSPSSLVEGIGNGAHLHFSLCRNGLPLFSGGDHVRGLTTDGAHAIAGLLQWLPESLGILAPSLLSASRLQPGKWSGAWICWGVENREAAVRLCQATMGNPYGANVEIKVTDHTINPYAAVAVILGLAQRGIEQCLDLPHEAPENPNKLSDDERRALHLHVFDTDQGRNLDATVHSEVLASVLGVTMLDIVGAVRRREIDVAATQNIERLIEDFRFAWSS
jgi:glutamine synthetase